MKVPPPAPPPSPPACPAPAVNTGSIRPDSIGVSGSLPGLLAALALLAPAWVRGDDGRVVEFADAARVLQQSCSDCHGDGSDEGGFSLSHVESASSLDENFVGWQKIRERIVDRSMPPADAEPLPDEVRQALVAWIDEASLAAICGDGPSAGPPLLRRLARHEYANTIRDLLDIHFDAGQGLPEETAGGEGFTNAAETLILSPIHAEKYLQAATDALQYAATDARARRRLLAARPENSGSDADPGSERAAAEENLRQLAIRAFRRPVGDRQLEPYLALFDAARADDLPYDEAVLYAMRGILISPSFLFIAEASPQAIGVAEPLTDHELAVRLSYFLWATTPDDELREAADAGRLGDPEELKKQTLRLLTERGTHLRDSMEPFVGSWLGTADLGRSKKVDRQQHPWVADMHVAALRNQPVYVMESVLQENEPILALIDASWTYLNNELLRVYGLKRSKFKEESFQQRLVRVELPDEYQYRGGLLGMGGVHAVSAYPRRSSPVLRGGWVLEKMLGVELPPPPPDIPALDESPTAAQTRTLRQRLEQHRQDAACASCHDRIDPIGFALENFDEIGRWRDSDEGGEIDARVQLADGTELDGVAGLKKHLMDQKDTFARVLTRKMLGYALGRSLRPTDLCTVETILDRLRENEYRGQELVLGIVMSEPFRKKMLTDEENR